MLARGFHPFHPRVMRRWLLGGAIASLGLAAWAVAGLAHGTELLGPARAAACLGLFAALMVTHRRLRPRAGWGVAISASGLRVSRPLRGDTEIPWSAVQGVSRQGRRREALVIALVPVGTIVLHRALFASQAEFLALAEAVEASSPQRFDA